MPACVAQHACTAKCIAPIGDAFRHRLSAVYLRPWCADIVQKYLCCLRVRTRGSAHAFSWGDEMHGSRFPPAWHARGLTASGDDAESIAALTPTRYAARLASAAIRGFLRDTDELSQHACGRTLLAHLQACETLQIAFRPPHRLRFGTPVAVDRQQTGVKTHRIGGGVGVIPQVQSGRPDGLTVALGGPGSGSATAHTTAGTALPAWAGAPHGRRRPGAHRRATAWHSVATRPHAAECGTTHR